MPAQGIKSEQELKQKYSSVIELAQEIGVHLEKVNLEGDQLLIRGKAGNEQTKNQLWDQVKGIDPAYHDLHLDIAIDPSLNKPQQTSAAPDPTSVASTYTVRSGDTLSKIARQFYGSADEYTKIFEANRDQLKDPDRILPGQLLKIPK